MPVNRFFQPQRGQYISQFVPEELPTDLMIGALANKQKKYDVQSALNTTLGEWNERALPGYDTKYVNKWKQDIQNFVDSSQGQDLSSPEYQRKYMDFYKKFKNDQGLNAVRSSVARDDSFWKRVNELKQDKNTAAYAEGLANEYLTRRSKYTSDNGFGFTGPIQLGDENVLTGTDTIQDAKTLFDDIKASGSEAAKELEQGIYYKNGWEGVSGNTISNRVGQMLESFTNSRAGQQLTADYDQKVFGNEVPSIELSKLDNENRQKYEAGKRQYIADFLNKAGGEFIYNKSSTNIDQAKNKLADWTKEDLKDYPQQPNISIKGYTTGYDMPNWEETFGNGVDKGMYSKTIDDQAKTNAYINSDKTLLNYIKTGQGIKKDQYGKPILTSYQVNSIQGIPGAKEFMSGQPVPSSVKETFLNALQDRVDMNVIKSSESGRILKEINEKLRNASSSIMGDKKYNGLTFKEALDKQDEFFNDQSLKAYSTVYSKIYGSENKIKFLDDNIHSLTEQVKSEKDPDKKRKYLTIINKLNNTKAYENANKDFHSILTPDPTKPENIEAAKARLDKLKLAFNTINEYVPTATLKPLNRTYNAYKIDEKTGKPIKVGPTVNADHIIEDLAKKDPSNFIVIDQDSGERIYPTMINQEGETVPNPEFPVGKFLQLVSSDKELIRDNTSGEKYGTKAQFNFTGQVPVATADINDPEKLKMTLKDKRYKLVAAGTAVKTYAEAKAQEAYSNYILDPNSTAGQQSYMDYKTYKNPDKYKDLSKVNSLTKDGESAFIPRTFYNTETHQPQQYEVKVTKSKSGDNNFIMKVFDNTGKEVISEKRFKNISDLDKTLDGIEDNTKANVEHQKSLGIQPNLEEVQNQYDRDSWKFFPVIPINAKTATTYQR